MNTKKKALGRGLSALLENPATDITSKNDMSGKYVVGAVSEIPIDKIEANPFQPRNKFEEEALKELSESIAEHGIIQPITVRKLGYGKYQLISGERRFKAAIMAGLTEIPAYIRIANDKQMLEMALVENIQREDLNAIEIAISYQRLIEECNLSQEELSEKVGKDRSTIANYLRLLKLSLQSQIAVRDNKISMGHARAMVVIEDDELQNKLLNEIIKNGLSVRQTESLVKKYNAEQGVVKRKMKLTLSPSVTDFQVEFSKKLKTKVSISKTSTGKGKISIPFTSPEDLERIINILK